MAAGGTNVFFVPYRPHSKSKKPSSGDKPAISQQKHAAREYHRKAKLERMAKPRPVGRQCARSSSVVPYDPDSSSRPLLPRNKSAPGEGGFDKSFILFDAGTGQLDPFHVSVPDSAPIYALDVLDYGRSVFQSIFTLCLAHYPIIEAPPASLTSTSATSRQWRVFSSSKTLVSEANIKHAVLACAMHSAAAFWSIIFAGATHNAYLEQGTDILSRNRTLRLSYKSQAIKELNREIQTLQGPASDELLLAIITLAAHGTGEKLVPPSQTEQLSVLETVQNFQYYGRMDWEAAHFKAVAHLVHQKGGLHTVRMPGLANAIGLADIFLAFQHLQPPAFPLLAPSSLIMSTWPAPPIHLTASFQSMTYGFGEFYAVDEFTQMLDIIANARLITIGLHMHLSHHAEAPTINRIVWARNFMTHDLLSLPTTLPYPSPRPPSKQQPPPPPNSNPTVSVFSSQALWNLIRISTLAYTSLVLFPMPRITGLHAKISRELMLALEECAALQQWSTHPHLLLWSTLLGGMVSENDGLKSWFAAFVRQATTKLPDLVPPGQRRRSRSQHTRNPSTNNMDETCDSSTWESNATWPAVREICFRFLWFDGAECDGAGRGFWNLACEERGLAAGGGGDVPPASSHLF